MIEKSLVEHLKANLTLVQGRVFPLTLPSGSVLPALTYQRIPRLRLSSHTGLTGLTVSVFQLDVWSGDYEVIKAVSGQIRQCSSGFPGMMGTTNQTKVHAVIPADDRDDYDPELPMYRVTVELTISFQED